MEELLPGLLPDIQCVDYTLLYTIINIIQFHSNPFFQLLTPSLFFFRKAKTRQHMIMHYVCLIINVNSYFFLLLFILSNQKMKDFRHLHSEQSQESGSANWSKVNGQKESTTGKYIIFGLFVAMVICTIINLLVPASTPLGYEDSVIVDQLSNKDVTLDQQYISEFEEYSQRRNVTKYHVPLSSRAKQRISYGQPRPRNSTLKAVIIEKEGNIKQPTCVLTNGVNVISSKTTTTALNMLAESTVSKWIVYLGSADEVGDNLVTKIQGSLPSGLKVKKIKQVTIDANYQFVTKYTKDCTSVIYLQNPFVITPDKSKTLVQTTKLIQQQHKQGYVAYSQTMYNEQGAQKLDDLKTADLYSFQQQKITNYIFIFDSQLLEVITPLNFVNFNKYTFEQIFIYPLLALTQKSEHLVPFKGSFHTYDEVGIQFKEFALKQVQSVRNLPCFVSFSSIPNQFQLQQTIDYFKSLGSMEFNSTSSYTIVINLPYNFDSKVKENIFQAYQKLRQIFKKFTNIRIRISLKYLKASSALAVYQATHTFCPKSALIISSRLNIEFNKNFLKEIESTVSQKFHYYHTGKLNLKDDEKLMDVMTKNKNKQRFSTYKYNSDFSHVQIFKSDFMRMIHLWALKYDEDNFYQTQASFVLPMLEMIDYQVMQLQTLYKISDPRKSTDIENIEIKRLQKYGVWQKLQLNVLRPIPFNSLTNLDLRRNKMDQIPKSIHQIWFKQEKIPENLKKLQASIKEVNKGYKYTLWKRENFTFQEFPLCYAFVARTIQYEWAENKSFHPWIQALMSYQILHNHGGIYLGLNAQSRKPLDKYLKYELFFAGFYSEFGTYEPPVSVGRQIMGAKRYSYHLRFVLSQLITEQILDYQCADYQAIVGGDILRVSLLDDQLYTTVGFGFHLVNYDPHRKGVRGLCNLNQFPCKQYEEAYVVFHTFV